MIPDTLARKMRKLGREIMPAGKRLHYRDGRSVIARLVRADKNVPVPHPEGCEHQKTRQQKNKPERYPVPPAKFRVAPINVGQQNIIRRPSPQPIDKRNRRDKEDKVAPQQRPRCPIKKQGAQVSPPTAYQQAA